MCPVSYTHLALRKYGTAVDGGFEVHFEGEQPIVAGYLFDEPRDIVIDAARLDSDGNLSLLGEDKEVRDGKYDICLLYTSHRRSSRHEH